MTYKYLKDWELEDNKEYSQEELIKKWGTMTLVSRIKSGEIYQNKPGFFRKTEE